MDINPCEETIDILVDKFGSEQESFIITDTLSGHTYTNYYNSQTNPEDPTAHTDFATVFYDYADGDTGYFRFNLQLNNLSANVFDETVSDDDGDGNITKIHYKLVHKPK